MKLMPRATARQSFILAAVTLLAAGLAGTSVAETATTARADSPAAGSLPPTTQPGDPASDPAIQKLPSGLVIETVAVPEAPLLARPGDTVFVHYTGRLENGRVFDSSLNPPQPGRPVEPISFELGAGRVIKGWDQGIEGMRVGEKRKLTIPPALGYGERGAGNVIPPNATLVFDVQLVGVYRAGE
ncbi:MAG: FKBP-type peptidyl-prolyl cis-trans isomerase [Phycisphaerae bacterium]